MKRNLHFSKKLSTKEEIANTITHAVGAVVMLILLPISAVYSYIFHGVLQAVGASIFVMSIFLMLLSSTIYHAMDYGSIHKYVLRIIDHSMIYVAIAGSYTPVAFSLVKGWLGLGLMVLQWLMTLFGIFYKIFSKTINEKFSLVLYLAMGWLVVVMLPMIIQKLTPPFVVFMLAGGLSYTVGTWFYVKKRPYFHMIWHLFILLASILQYVGIVYYML